MKHDIFIAWAVLFAAVSPGLADDPIYGRFSRTDVYDAQGGGKLPPIIRTMHFGGNGIVEVTTERADKPTGTSLWTYVVSPFRILVMRIPSEQPVYCPWTDKGLSIHSDPISHRGEVFAAHRPDSTVATEIDKWDPMGVYTQSISFDHQTVAAMTLTLRDQGEVVVSVAGASNQQKVVTGSWERTDGRILEYTQENGWKGQIVWSTTNLILNHYPVKIEIDAIRTPNHGLVRTGDPQTARQSAQP